MSIFDPDPHYGDNPVLMVAFVILILLVGSILIQTSCSSETSFHISPSEPELKSTYVFADQTMQVRPIVEKPYANP